MAQNEQTCSKCGVVIKPLNKFELELRFHPVDDYINKLINAGCHLKETLFIQDTYFDTPFYLLAKNDLWLRRRQNEADQTSIWELKVRKKISSPPYNNSVTIFQEINQEKQIWEMLNQIPEIVPYLPKTGQGEQLINGELAAIALAWPMLATYTTKRNIWTHTEATIVIDEIVDEEYGKQIFGELEIMTENSNETTALSHKLQEILQTLNLGEITEGKFLTILKNKNKEAYNIIQKKNMTLNLNAQDLNEQVNPNQQEQVTTTH